MPQLFDPGIYSLVNQVGAPGSGYKVAFYATGSSSKLDTYPTSSDASAGTNANSNPVIADANGRLPPIWLKDAVYKAILLTSADVVIKTIDPANSLPSITATALAASTGAGLIGATSGGTVQANLNTLAAGVSSAATAAGIASSVSNILPSAPAALPYEVTGISGGVATGTGGTPGTYVGGVSGGPAGFQWTYTIGGDGKLLSYAITNPGLSTSNSAPTLSLPSGSLTSPTIPTATVGTIPVNRNFYAVTSDSQYAALWTNAAGSLAKVNGPDGTQVKMPLSNIALDLVNATKRDAAPNLGAGAMLWRSAIQRGYQLVNNSGAATVNANVCTTGFIPIAESTGLASSVGSQALTSGASFFFYDRNSTAVCAAHAAFTATFVAGSPNFTLTAYINENVYLAPPGAPNLTPPLCNGLMLVDGTNNNNSIIPAGAYCTALPAAPYATGTGFTMSGNAVANGTITVYAGGCSPGVPVLPPPGYGIAQARYQQYVTNFGAAVTVDGLDDIALYPFAFGAAGEKRTSGTATPLPYLTSPHQYGLGWTDLEVERPWLGKTGGVIGDSILYDWMWSKTFEYVTRTKIALRAAVSARQPHQFLSGCGNDGSGNTGSNAYENWNQINPSNLNSALTATDVVGLDYLIIGPPTNAFGYNYGSGNFQGNNAGGDHRQPYMLGTSADTAPVAVFQYTTTNNNAIITVSGLESGTIKPGAAFPTGTLNGLAGLVFQAYGTSGTSGTGGNGTYALNTGVGVTAGGPSWATVGTLWGTYNNMLATLAAWNTTNGTSFLPVLMTPLPRYDGTSANGGTGDAVNRGNPSNSLSLRLNQYADTITAIGKAWHVPVVDCFYNTPFGPFSTVKYYETALLHPRNVADSPNGSRLLGTYLGKQLNLLGPVT